MLNTRITLSLTNPEWKAASGLQRACCTARPNRALRSTRPGVAMAAGKGFGKAPEAKTSKKAPAQVPFQFNLGEAEASAPAEMPMPSMANNNIDTVLAESSGKILPEAPEGSDGRIEIVVTMQDIEKLDITQAKNLLEPLLESEDGAEQIMKRTVGFKIDFVKEDEMDPRELCEIPDVRLWFLRLDAEYPWLPCVLDWRAGEMARYAAMLTPHQISVRDGLVFNPEGIELFINLKAIVCCKWLKEVRAKSPNQRLKDMMLMLGFTLDDAFFELM